MRDLIGRTLGHLRIVEKIGEGGMGEVYRAQDERLDRDVAIKVLPEAVASDESRLARFRREAKAVAALSHPNILEIFSFDTEQDVTYAVTELLEGQTLAEHLEGEPGLLPLSRVHQIAAAVAAGLGAAHGRGVIHRDIKPSNIFLCADGRVKILDFGLARDVETDSEDGSTSPTLSYYTDLGAVLGTVGFMSPEQVRGEPADRRSDVFSFGCVVYEMLTGRRAFDRGSAAETMAQILNENPDPVRKLRDDVVPKFVDIVNRAMRKDPAERYQRVDELLADLDEARRQIVTPTIGLTRWFKRRRKVVAACLAALVVVAAVAVVAIRHRQRSERIAAVISELLPAAEAGRFEEVHAELTRQAVSLAEVEDKAFLDRVAGTLSIESDPAHAVVTVERVTAEPELSPAEPVGLGRTPIENSALIAGEYLVRLTAEGRPPIEFLVNIDPGGSAVERRGFATADAPEMARVEAGASQSGDVIPAFLIDRREVTNEDYFRFVAAGGYRDSALWPEMLLMNTEAVPRDAAMATFVDQTGLNGPRFWSNGKFQDGRQDHPVVGVSWYEAAAYAKWAGKMLPTFEQWWRAAVGDRHTVFPWGNDVKTIHLRANFGMRGPEPVGMMPLGLSPFGCFDMAGNVREWVGGTEPGAGEHLAVGGSWKEPSYMFGTSLAEPVDAGQRRDRIGFRCAKPLAGE